ncbi:MAG: hypothetical protein AB8H79_05170 [Myxococcota bacterium]
MSREESPSPHRLSLVRSDTQADDELLGLREEDLQPSERKRLGTTLSTTKGSVERAGAMTLAREIGSLPAPQSGLHAAHVLHALDARKRRRGRWNRLGLATLGLGLIAGLGAAVAIAAQPAPWTGQHVTLEAQAIYGSDTKQIWGAAEVPDSSTVHLTMTTTGPGTLFVEERWGYGTVERIAPTSGRWEVKAGTHHVERGLSPAHSPLDVRYQAWFCPPGFDVPNRWDCRRDRVEVSWVR